MGIPNLMRHGDTVECRYNAVKRNMILHMIRQWKAKHASDVIFSKDTPYLALTGELWDVFCEDLGDNWLRYNGTALYIESGTHVTNPLWAHILNLIKICVAFCENFQKIGSQFYRSRQLSCRDLCKFVMWLSLESYSISPKRILTRFQFWAGKLFMKIGPRDWHLDTALRGSQIFEGILVVIHYRPVHHAINPLICWIILKKMYTLCFFLLYHSATLILCL